MVQTVHYTAGREGTSKQGSVCWLAAVSPTAESWCVCATLLLVSIPTSQVLDTVCFKQHKSQKGLPHTHTHAVLSHKLVLSPSGHLSLSVVLMSSGSARIPRAVVSKTEATSYEAAPGLSSESNTQVQHSIRGVFFRVLRSPVSKSCSLLHFSFSYFVVFSPSLPLPL